MNLDLWIPGDQKAFTQLLATVGVLRKCIHCAQQSPTLSGHIDKIPWITLPKTFRDAIEVTRNIGIKYIWIDSLCIAQDDQEDWERESSTMASVYERCYLNISATDSNDSTGGCFLKQPHIQQLEFPYISSNGDTAGSFYLLEAFSYRDLDLSPLNKRGWVLQEQYDAAVTIAQMDLCLLCQTSFTSSGLFHLTRVVLAL